MPPIKPDRIIDLGMEPHPHLVPNRSRSSRTWDTDSNTIIHSRQASCDISRGTGSFRLLVRSAQLIYVMLSRRWYEAPYLIRPTFEITIKGIIPTVVISMWSMLIVTRRIGEPAKRWNWAYHSMSQCHLYRKGTLASGTHALAYVSWRNLLFRHFHIHLSFSCMHWSYSCGL